MYETFESHFHKKLLINRFSKLNFLVPFFRRWGGGKKN